MEQKYVVYVEAPDEAPSPESRRKLAELLKLDSSKLDHLLRRLPGEVTKPVGESTAITVARRFRDASLTAFIRPHSGGTPPADGEPASGTGSGTGVETPSPTASATDSAPQPEREERGAQQARRDNRPTYSRAPEPPGFEDDPDVDDLAWKTEFGASGSTRRDEPAEDELFPPSAFHEGRSVKAPSKPLVIAFIAVLAILVVLWIFL